MNNEELLEQFGKEFEERKNKYKTYTWEELNKFEELGIEGDVCKCNIKIANTMTVECIICGKVQSQYAKQYLRRQKQKDALPKKTETGEKDGK